ncbi:MAG: LysM peptidoglycan-binding domain-containing protein [Anaerolineae bacterium]|nr:LysM peptidoglycan-binding domain-containing protein [Anaerolineae bacterium]
MSEEPTVPVATEEPRHCPECGTRVAKQATTCLMCGASLVATVEEDAPAEKKAQVRPQHHPSRWLFWVAVTAVVLIVFLVARELLLPLVAPELNATPTPTASSTAAPTRTIVVTPSATPPPTPTATPLPPRAHQVQEGETLSDIAALYDTTVDEILALNPGITPELLQVSQVLLIPPAIPTPAPTGTPLPEGPTPTPADYIIHIVAAGDTLISIAEQYSVTLSILWEANPDIPVGSDVIRVNQTIIVPQNLPEPTAMPAFDPNATPTPISVYRAPSLLSPADEAVFSGPEAVIVLEWSSVGILQSGEWYELRIGPPVGDPVIVRTWSTAYRVPADLYPPSGMPTRTFRWQVNVVRQIRGTEEYAPASEPGGIMVFYWLETLPATPTPSPTATP